MTWHDLIYLALVAILWYAFDQIEKLDKRIRTIERELEEMRRR
jgi:hypothetical protein